MLAEAAPQLVPLLLRDRARLDDVADDARAGAVLFVALQMDERQRHFAFPQVAADGLAHRFGVARVIEQVVDELERDSQIEAVFPQRLLALLRDGAEQT